VNEIDFVDSLRRRSSLIGDDCAVVPSGGRKDLLLTTDFTIESVHFRRTARAADVGAQAVSRSLSDIAAMGGEPLYCLVAVALAPWTTDRWLNGFYRGVGRALGRCKLAGGDVSHGARLVVNVTAVGEVGHGKALLRSGAHPGDWILVSGKLGGWRHKKRIAPRLDVGRKIAGKATACIDISDGLAMDLFRLCSASGVAAELDTVPLLRGATEKQALNDGEDYELLYTAAPGTRVPGIRIGRVTEAATPVITLRGRRIDPAGYDHFRQLRRTARV
jgi:thiamine-monophosphate kinase